jgi:hypothetical protein
MASAIIQGAQATLPELRLCSRRFLRVNRPWDFNEEVNLDCFLALE